MTYEYKCRQCGEIQEEKHSYKEEPVISCNNCGSTDTFRYLGNHNATILYNGTGWTRKDQENEKAGIPHEVAQTAEDLGKI